MHWRRKWQPISLFLPGESQGWWSLVGCRLRGHIVCHIVGCDWSDSAAAAAAPSGTQKSNEWTRYGTHSDRDEALKACWLKEARPQIVQAAWCHSEEARNISLCWEKPGPQLRLGWGEDWRMERKHWEDSGRWLCSVSWSDDAGDKSDFTLQKFIKPDPYDMCAFLCEYYTLVESIFRNAVNDGCIHFISLINSLICFLCPGHSQSSDCYNIPQYPGLIEQVDIFIPITNQQADKQAYYWMCMRLFCWRFFHSFNIKTNTPCVLRFCSKESPSRSD